MPINYTACKDCGSAMHIEDSDCIQCGWQKPNRTPTTIANNVFTVQNGPAIVVMPEGDVLRSTVAADDIDTDALSGGFPEWGER